MKDLVEGGVVDHGEGVPSGSRRLGTQEDKAKERYLSWVGPSLLR